jgi:hypothetical protein
MFSTRRTEANARRVLLILASFELSSGFVGRIIDREEQVQPASWKLCTSEELATTFRRITTSQRPEELMNNLGMMIQAINLYERIDLLTEIQATALSETFRARASANASPTPTTGRS